MGNIDFNPTAPNVEKAWKGIVADKLAKTIEMTRICESSLAQVYYN